MGTVKTVETLKKSQKSYVQTGGKKGTQ